MLTEALSGARARHCRTQPCDRPCLVLRAGVSRLCHERSRQVQHIGRRAEGEQGASLGNRLLLSCAEDDARRRYRNAR